ncbi:MAG: PH domain-containing protein, partial [Nocardioidaceae bacterium]|nr:PH domain-containing protein [Nocardioidaceae bacterium]
PRTWRPIGPRYAAIAFGIALLAMFLIMWFTFPQQTKDAIGPLERLTVLGFVLLGDALLYALARSRITATDDGLVIVNGYRKRQFAWAQVVAVRLPKGAPWPTLDLSDGTTCSAMGIHQSDGEKARYAVRELKTYLALRSTPER